MSARIAAAPLGEKLAFNVAEFLAAHGIGRTTFYAEVKAGRLRTVRCGGRVLVLREDADAWRLSLPTGR